MSLCLPCLLANPRRRPSRLPRLPPLTELGTLQELRIERDKDGEEEVHRFGGPLEDGPRLYYSTDHHLLLSFPGLKPKHVSDFPHGMDEKQAKKLFKDDGIDKAVALFRRWSIHDPSSLEKFRQPNGVLRPYGRPVHIVYRSDKFNEDGVLENHIHPCPKSNRVAFAAGKTPSIIAIWGPALTVTERGIVN